MADVSGWHTFLTTVSAVASAVAAWRSWTAAERANDTSKQSLETAIKANETSLRALAFHTLSDLLRDYGTPSMHKALVFLADEFKGRDREGLRRYYLELLSGNGKSHWEENRRPVSHFFQRMAALRDALILDDDTLFLGWAKSDFAIIDIIVGLEDAVADHLKGDATHTTKSLLLLKKAGEESYERRIAKTA